MTLLGIIKFPKHVFHKRYPVYSPEDLASSGRVRVSTGAGIGGIPTRLLTENPLPPSRGIHWYDVSIRLNGTDGIRYPVGCFNLHEELPAVWGVAWEDISGYINVTFAGFTGDYAALNGTHPLAYSSVGRPLYQPRSWNGGVGVVSGSARIYVIPVMDSDYPGIGYRWSCNVEHPDGYTLFTFDSAVPCMPDGTYPLVIDDLGGTPTCQVSDSETNLWDT